jgi:hypothetical protein
LADSSICVTVARSLAASGFLSTITLARSSKGSAPW